MTESGTVGLVAVTAAGRSAAGELAAAWPDARVYDPADHPGGVSGAIAAAFAQCGGLVCFLASGATIRLVAPLLAGKATDPGVVCVDEGRRWAVALLGGHAGGANVLAERVAATLGATAVVTTGSDSAGVAALDSFGADVGLRVEPGSELAKVGAALLSGAPVRFRSDETWPVPPLPPNVTRAEPVAAGRVEPAGEPAIVVTDRVDADSGPAVVYRPPSLAVGVGASRGAPAEEIDALVDRVLAGAGLSPLAVRHLATAEVKRDEPGIVEVAGRRGWPLVAYPAETLAGVDVPTPSEVVRAAVGTPSVAEAAAMMDPSGDGVAAGTVLVAAKTASAHATVAVARHRPRGRLALVGLGPGARGLLAPRAAAELARASVVVGLDQYVDAVADLVRPGATVLASALGDEEARARAAVEQARAGHAVALIGSGDAGVYAMASPALEQADGSFDVVGVPGVTAALAASALLGAPLGHDHASISLSDLHTPWDVIEQRVRAVAEADFVVAFYNPRSRTRTWQLPKALGLLAGHRPPGTPVGIVTAAFRPDQKVTVTTLAELDEETVAAQVSMTTTVVVGNSRTRLVAGRMVTPRGYMWA